MKKIKVYMLRVSDDGRPYRGYLSEIENSLEAKQAYVGGLIEVLRLTEEIDIIFNEEGKLLPLPINRWLISDGGRIFDGIMGNILCCRHNDEGEFTDIQEEDIPVIQRYLRVLYSNYCIPEELLKEYSDENR